tara:strand:- start:16 stop:144 length:129 start_codon:yes stop_codon:yes gene_type:complete
MIKKITFTLILLIFVSSCGKKGDPEYKANKSNIADTKILMVS